MNSEDFQARVDRLRANWPTWTTLRVIGNSRPAQIATTFPLIGYFILLSSPVTDLIDGGIAGKTGVSMSEKLWSLKLYFVYFGLIAIGAGSLLYQLRCPRLVKAFADNAEYVRLQFAATSEQEFNFMAAETAVRVSPGYGVATMDKIPVMTNFYALESAKRPWSRLITTTAFAVGFGLLSVPSFLTLERIAKLFVARLAS